MPGRVLVTGASGFIGGHVVRACARAGRPVRAMSRRVPVGETLPGVESVVADFLDEARLGEVCRGVEAIVHCAGHAHAHGGLGDDAALHIASNLVTTRTLAETATRAGVARLVFVSSVKAVGAPAESVVDEAWPVPPESAYGRSKRAAEDFLAEHAARTGMQVISLRPAMVYGPGSRGNLERMLRGVRAGWFPPLPETGGKRSLVHVDDLVAAIVRCVDAGRAPRQVYNVAHPERHSGAELYDAMRRALRLPAARLRVPARVLRLAGRAGDLVGRLASRRVPIDSLVVERLLGPEAYSAAALESDLGWHARVTLEAGLRGLVEGGAV